MHSSTALLGGICVAVDVVAAALVAWRLSGRAVEQRDTETCRLLVALLIGLSQLIGVELVCGALVVLYAPVVLGANVVVAAAVWRWVPAEERKPGVSPRPGREAAVLGGVLAFVATLAAILSARGAPTDPDDIQYHVPNAASWLQVHDIWHLPAADPGYFTNAYPSDGELLTSWIMQPFHGAELTSWPTLLFGVLILLACAVIAEQLGRRAMVGLLAGAAVILTPISWQTQVHSALTDWTSTAGLLAGVALALRSRKESRWCWPLLAGLAFGVAVGSKDTSLLPAAAGVIFATVVAGPDRRWRTLLLVVGGIVAMAGLWFVRTGIDTGNPIYPEPLRVAGATILPGGVSPLTQYSTSLAKDVATVQGHALRTWAHYARTLVGPALLVSLGALLAVWNPRRRPLLASCSVLALLFAVAYALTPFTGPGSEGFLIASQLRYALPALALGAVCGCVASRWFQYLAWIAIGFDLLKIVRHSTVNPSVNASHFTLAIAAVVGIAMAAGLWRVDRGVLSEWAYAMGHDATTRMVLAGVLLLALVGGSAALAKHRAPRPSLLDEALAAVAAQPNGEAFTKRPVMIIGAVDVLGALGDHIDNRLVGVGTGTADEVPITLSAELDRRIAKVQPKAVVLGPQGAAGVIHGWSPKGYLLAGDSGPDQIYVIRP